MAAPPTRQGEPERRVAERLIPPGVAGLGPHGGASGPPRLQAKPAAEVGGGGALHHISHASSASACAWGAAQHRGAVDQDMVK
jgi:hypothetical protein